MIDPPPINEPGSRVNLDILRTYLRRSRNGSKEIYDGADYRVFAAGRGDISRTGSIETRQPISSSCRFVSRDFAYGRVSRTCIFYSIPYQFLTFNIVNCLI